MAELVVDENGEEVGETGVVQDIADQVERDELIRQFQKMDVFGHLVAGAAHDFNNVLASIAGNAELLREIYRGSEPIIDAQSSSAMPGTELSQRLLAFSRRTSMTRCGERSGRE